MFLEKLCSRIGLSGLKSGNSKLRKISSGVGTLGVIAAGLIALPSLNFKPATTTFFNADDSFHYSFSGTREEMLELIWSDFGRQPLEEAWVYFPEYKKGYEIGIDARVKKYGESDFRGSITYDEVALFCLKLAHPNSNREIINPHLPPNAKMQNLSTLPVVAAHEPDIYDDDRARLRANILFPFRNYPSMRDFKTARNSNHKTSTHGIISESGITYYYCNANWTDVGIDNILGDVKFELIHGLPRVYDDNFNLFYIPKELINRNDFLVQYDTDRIQF